MPSRKDIDPLLRIALATLTAGGIMLSLGIVPLWLVTTFLPGMESAFLGFLFLLLTPPGAIILAIGLVIWLVAMIRRARR